MFLTNFIFTIKFPACKVTKFMRKEMYIIRGSKSEEYNAFTNRVLQIAREVQEKTKPPAIKLTLTTEAPPPISVIPFKKAKIAIISVYRFENDSIDLLKAADGFSAALKVDEAIPVTYEKNWEDGLPSPGACLLTLFHRRPGIDYDTFIDRWHNSHTPLSLKLHPLCNYNRNVVLQQICDKGEWWDGIVEEQTRTRSELLNPFKFFGNKINIIGNMLSVYTDTKSFLDYKTIETYLTTEYHIQSF
jgi:hypothetical protein